MSTRVRTRPIPIVAAERIRAGKWEAVCMGCPDYHGPRRTTYAAAMVDGSAHQTEAHGVPCPST